jgi:hypothetical protein
MKSTLFFAAFFSLVFASCGNSNELSTDETVLPAISSTTLDLGDSCNQINYALSEQKLDEVSIVNKEAKTEPYSYEKNGVFHESLKEYRSFIRGLDLPTLWFEQMALVDDLEDYLVALNRFSESKFRDLSINDAQIPLDDSLKDFRLAFSEVCANR